MSSQEEPESEDRPKPCEFDAAGIAAVKVFPGNNNTTLGPLQVLMVEAQRVIASEVWDVLVVVRDSNGGLQLTYSASDDAGIMEMAAFAMGEITDFIRISNSPPEE
jgi:hypothetical protein